MRTLLPITVAMLFLVGESRAQQSSWTPTARDHQLFDGIKVFWAPSSLLVRGCISPQDGQWWFSSDGNPSGSAPGALATPFRKLIRHFHERWQWTGASVVARPEAPHDLEAWVEYRGFCNDSGGGEPSDATTLRIAAWVAGQRKEIASARADGIVVFMHPDRIANQLMAMVVQDSSVVELVQRLKAPPKPAPRPVVAAAPAAPPAVAPVPVEQQVREHHDKAKRAFDVGHFDDAIREWEVAYGLDARPKLLYNLGTAYQRRGELNDRVPDLKMARHLLERYQAEAKDVDVSEQLKQVDDQLHRLEH